jgi:hypothetical protein
MVVPLDLAFGIALTVAGWIGLLLAVVHSRHVIGRLNAPAVNRRGDRQADAAESSDDE